MFVAYGCSFRSRFPFYDAPALCLALMVLVGCINYYPSHEVWVHLDTEQPSQLQLVEQIILATGMERNPHNIDQTEALSVKGKVYFVSWFRWQSDPRVAVIVNRSEDRKMLQVRLEDGGKDGWNWRPAVLDVAKKIEADLKNKFSTERLYIPVDMSQHKVE